MLNLTLDHDHATISVGNAISRTECNTVVSSTHHQWKYQSCTKSLIWCRENDARNLWKLKASNMQSVYVFHHFSPLVWRVVLSLQGLQRKHQSSASLALFEGNPSVTGWFSAQNASNEESISMWWRLHDMISMITLHVPWRPSSPGVGVTKAPFANFSLSKIFDLAKVPVRFPESHSYLTGVTAAELRRHLPNMNAIFNS